MKKGRRTMPESADTGERRRRTDKAAEGQWTLGVKRSDGGWAVIGWDDLVARLKEMDIADAMIRALQANLRKEEARMSDGERIIGENVSTYMSADSALPPVSPHESPIRRRMLDLLIFCAEHGKVANGTTGAMDLLKTFEAFTRAALRDGPRKGI